MSKLYHANQFETAFIPSMIGNYEVPRYFCDMPKTRINGTEIISNNRGYILPGGPRPKDHTIGGHFIGTWHMPKHLNRKTCNMLNGSDVARQKLIECREKAKLTAQQIKAIAERKARKEERELIKLLKMKQKRIEKILKEGGQLCPIHDIHVTYI